MRIDAVRAAKRYKYLMMNAPETALPAIRAVVPGLKSPTIVPLADPGWVAVHTAVEEEAFWESIERLRGRRRHRNPRLVTRKASAVAASLRRGALMRLGESPLPSTAPLSDRLEGAASLVGRGRATPPAVRPETFLITCTYRYAIL